MLAQEIIRTKLFIPSPRREFVSRPRLTDRLNTGLLRKLTLISAPAGFGKTTLLSEWIATLQPSPDQTHQEDFSIGWVSMDESDNDPSIFLSYLVTALRQINEKATIGEAALGMLQSPQLVPIDAILTTLINDLVGASVRTILVLDDLHAIDAQSIYDALNFLIENQPPQLHLVIATREDPNLPLASLRAKDQLVEIRAADLRFSSSEATEFLNQVMGLDLSEENITILEARTEGWIAGLQLAAISMQGKEDTETLIQSFAGSHRFVLDYLMEEVLEQQPESIRTFMVQTSILNRLTGSLCDALTGQEGGRQTLEYLDQANLFILPLDEERRWYRYHHLFADLLRKELWQTQKRKIPLFHQQSSNWYEQNGYVDEAIEHAMKGEDFKRAANLIEKHAEAIWRRGEHTKLRRWMDGLPTGVILARPRLCIFHAWEMFITGRQDVAERSLQAVEQSLDLSHTGSSESSLTDPGIPPETEKRKLIGRVATTRAFLAFYRGDVEEIRKFSLKALEYLPDEDSTWRSTATVALGDAYSLTGEVEEAHRVRLNAFEASKAAGNFYMILIAGIKLAISLRQQGRLEQVLQICQEQLDFASERGLLHTGVVGWLLAVWGEVLAEVNDLDEAINRAEKGVELAKKGKDLGMIGWANLCLIRVLYSMGDMVEAEAIVGKMENIARKNFVPPWITSLMSTWQARIWLAQHKLEAASQWVTERGLVTEGTLPYLGEMEYVVFARILIARGCLKEAIGLLERLLRGMETWGRVSGSIEILILQAIAYQAIGDKDQAMVAMEQALTLAKQGGFVRIFADEGPPIHHLLNEAIDRAIEPVYARRLITAISSGGPAQTNTSTVHADQSGLIEPLSDRELEVLQLLVEGLSNREIGERLYLSPNTVKVHTRNIYGKLDVHNRTQAVARAVELGLLFDS